MTSVSVEQFGPVPPTVSKRRYIYQTLKALLHSQEYVVGTRFPSAQLLADRFNVSHLTIHSALQDLVREGWLVRQQGKGTFVTEPHGRWKEATRYCAVMVLPWKSDIVESHNADVVFRMLHGCNSAMSKKGNILTIHTVDSRPDPAALDKIAHRIMEANGAVFIGNQYRDLMSQLEANGFPFVVLGTRLSLQAVVNYDSADAVRMAVEYLSCRRYERIGFVGDTDESRKAPTKYTLFCEFMREAGHQLSAEHCQHCATPSDAQQAARRFLQGQTLPQAVLVDNPLKAETLVLTAQAHGLRIPEDLAVLAYGVDPLRPSCMPLSMVAVPAEEMGEQGAFILDDLLNGKVSSPVRKTLKARLLVRGSCEIRADADGGRNSHVAERDIEQ